MKRISLLILSTFLCACIGNAQETPDYFSIGKYDIIDSAYMKITYLLDSKKDTTEAMHNKTESSDTQVLLIGKKGSKYYSQDVIDYNLQTYAEYIKKGRPYPRNKPGAYGFEIYKSNGEDKIKATDLGSRLGGNFVYDDNLSDLQWTIINNSDSVILNYQCQKATCVFRGRNYTAWFTPLIPVSNGPWKFGKLPGLILKIADNREHFIFECIGIQQLRLPEPIKYYKLDYTRTDRLGLLKLYKRYYDDSAAYDLAVHGTRSLELNSQTGKWEEVQHSRIKFPYNPIELE